MKNKKKIMINDAELRSAVIAFINDTTDYFCYNDILKNLGISNLEAFYKEKSFIIHNVIRDLIQSNKLTINSNFHYKRI